MQHMYFLYSFHSLGVRSVWSGTKSVLFLVIFCFFSNLQIPSSISKIFSFYSRFWSPTTLLANLIRNQNQKPWARKSFLCGLRGTNQPIRLIQVRLSVCPSAVNICLVIAITRQVSHGLPSKSYHRCILVRSRTSSVMGDLDPFFKVMALLQWT